MKIQWQIAPALLLSCVLPAQAQSNVKISGYLDVAIESVQTGNGILNRMSTGQLNQSRLNFTGAEDLGGGNHALFELQAAFSPDTGVGSSNGLFSRTAYVGLSNDRAGTIKVGRLQTLSDEVIGSLWALRWGASTNYFLYYGNTTQLVSNALRYESPRWSGLSFALGYSMPEGGTLGSVREVQVKYQDQKLLLNSAYYRSSGHDFIEAGSSVGIATVGASYNLGFIIPSITVQDVRTQDAVINKASKYDVALSAIIPMGAHSLWVDAGRLKNRAVKDADAKAFSIRFDYYLSKRTFLYAGAAQIWNGDNAYYQPMGASGSYPTVTTPAAVQTGNVPGYNGKNTHSFIGGIRLGF